MNKILKIRHRIHERSPFFSKVVYAFDFDGTLTTKDTLIEFIIHVFGRPACYKGFMKHWAMLTRMKMGLYSNSEAKERIFTYFFGGMRLSEFNYQCESFCEKNRFRLLRPDGILTIEKALAEGADVLIVSASIENWVRPFFVLHDVKVAGTQIETQDDGSGDPVITGRFRTPNCYGPEKVNRIRALYPDRDDYRLIAYGDSRGDKEMLDYADEEYLLYYERDRNDKDDEETAMPW